jgi:hypothetical protein
MKNEKKAEPGRNDPCPCGKINSQTGKPMKYKKCCWLKQVPLPSQESINEAVDFFMRMEGKKRELQDRGIFINYVRPCPFPDKKTGKMAKAWALGSRVFFPRPEKETFHEFIIDRLRCVMGREWWVEQGQVQEQHFIFKCFLKWNEWMKRNAVEENRVGDNLWVADNDGWTNTLISLAFDICSLEHTLQLPDFLLKRLRNRAEYQGAHYEIAVAAIFARLGCKIEFLDKTKIRTPHCEFIATHSETGVSIAVEAKSRQRPGVKHMEGTASREQLLCGNVKNLKNLIDRAFQQKPNDKSFIVFVDINAPLTPEIPVDKKPWFKGVQKIMDDYPAPTPQDPEKYTAIFFTNFSPHYNGEGKSDPNEYLAVIPQFSTYPMPNFKFGDMLIKAVQNYGFVPNIKEEK